ncbi:PqqD family protein [Sphingomonas sp. LB-2]|uniref:PqqD family protein n=1 Tax=Sphingomonas caeni TaxID=2984949 RepID=UPI002231FAC8|nr:PqqD family protein [Sphingomonas caeni]MCW3846656.1 PqqD family protein [Sphingomonas caeni]
MKDVPTIDATTRLRRKPGLVAADVADDAILLDIDSGYFFQLNRTGAKIWALVAEPQSLGAVCDHMANGFRVDPETCRSDVTEFVADLLERGVLEIEPV